VLSRKPSAADRAVCAKFLAATPDRTAALEDVLWALVNSTEFLLKK
jgi:hypothetical protein